ncbi:MAG: hypothetical protein Q4E61_04260, partial [Alphaproteobacteria bacterium]|nr:hypothetical protein [Alphaproteobacteria bacterium]
MYNEQIKQRYLDEIIQEQTNAPLIKGYFIETEKMEMQFGKDLYDFTPKEIIQYYKYVSTSSIQFLVLLNSIFSRYTSWAIANNMVKTSQNYYETITRDVLLSCINIRDLNNKIITKSQLNNAIKALYNPSDKFLMQALFEGIKGRGFEDLINVKLSDFNKENKTLKLYSGKTMSVSDELIRYAIQSEDDYEYYTLGTDNKSKFKDIPDYIF